METLKIMNIPKAQQQYTIVSQSFKSHETLFRLQKMGTYDFIERTAHEITLDTNILKHLSSIDAHLIGYVYATESLLHTFDLNLKYKF